MEKRQHRVLVLFVLLGLLACDSSGAADPPPPAPALVSDGGPPPAPAVPDAPPNPGESDESKKVPKDPASELVFGIASDTLFPIQNAAQLFADVRVDDLLAASETVDAKVGPLFPHETRVVAPAGKIGSRVVFRAQAIDDQGSVVSERHVTTAFTSGATKLVRVNLESSCGPSTCAEPGQTCIRYACASDKVTGLPDYAADWPTHPCGSGATPEVVLGKGVETVYDPFVFGPLSDGDDVKLNYGPQGGAHLYIALRVRNLPREKLVARLSADSGVYPMSTSVEWFANADGTCNLPTVQFRVDTPSTPPQQLPGKELQITANVEDNQGHAASTTRRVVIR